MYISMRLPPEDTLLEAGVEVGLSNRGISCCCLQIKEMCARTTPSSEPRSAQQSSQPQRHLHSFHKCCVKMELEIGFGYCRIAQLVSGMLSLSLSSLVLGSCRHSLVSREFRWALLMSLCHSVSHLTILFALIV